MLIVLTEKETTGNKSHAIMNALKSEFQSNNMFLVQYLKPRIVQRFFARDFNKLFAF